MTKAELIEEVSHAVEMTRKDSEVIVEAIFYSMVRALRAGDRIEIRGLGSFGTRQRRAAKIFFVKSLVIDRVLTYSEYRPAEAGVPAPSDSANQ